MNERIEQLAEQCWTHTSEPLFSVRSPHWEFDRHKFAELIVRECGRFVDFRNQKYMPSTITVTGDDLEELFGLKD